MTDEKKPEAMTPAKLEEIRERALALALSTQAARAFEPGRLDATWLACEAVPALLSALEEARRHLAEHKDFIQSLLGAAFGEERRGAGWETDASAVEDMRALAARVAELESGLALASDHVAALGRDRVALGAAIIGEDKTVWGRPLGDLVQQAKAARLAVGRVAELEGALRSEQEGAACFEGVWPDGRTGLEPAIGLLAAMSQGFKPTKTRRHPALAAPPEKAPPEDKPPASFVDWLKERAQAKAAPSCPLPPAGAPAFDMRTHLQRQREWSVKTFGPGHRPAGLLDHIRKELKEIERAPGDLEEWIDVVILAFDGAWRSGHSPDQIIAALVAKQTKNEGRKWPDWRIAAPGKAIEHARDEHPAPAAVTTGEAPHPKAATEIFAPPSALEHRIVDVFSNAPVPDDAAPADPLCARDLGGKVCGHPLSEHFHTVLLATPCNHRDSEDTPVCSCAGFVPGPEATPALSSERCSSCVVPAPSGVGDGGAAPREFPVTDDDLDAPDGAMITIEGTTYERVGSVWKSRGSPSSNTEVGETPGGTRFATWERNGGSSGESGGTSNG